MNELEIDELLEGFAKKVNDFEQFMKTQDESTLELIGLVNALSMCMNKLVDRLKALENFSLEINLLMGLMPGDDAKVH